MITRRHKRFFLACLLPLPLILIQSSTSPRSIPLSSSAQLRAPLWAKTAVWYQIFPERFRNGDTSNDPRPADLAGSWPHTVPPGWQTSPWTDDWYELQPWEKEGAKGFYFHAQNRRYGGDLQGVIQELDYLKELGITAIYFNPLFESPSLHKYDAAAYHHIDNNFGPAAVGDEEAAKTEDPNEPGSWRWTGADRLFLDLIARAHAKGIRVVIDGVFNHVGLRFWAFQDVMKNQQRSQYSSWFTIKRWDDPSTKENEFDYVGWAGVRELPEVARTSAGLVEPFERHVHAIVKRWMDPNGDGDPSDGIDGWRLDVAEKVPIPFWKKFRSWVKGVNPDAYLVGEVWWEDWRNDKMFNAAPWLQGDVFDAVMNYRWAREAFRFFGAKKTGITPSEFSRRLQALLLDYPSEANQVLMNLYESHDTDRIGSRLLNSDLPYDHQASPGDNPTYDVSKPGAQELKIQMLMIMFQMTYVGAPMVYYGSEVGMWGADDPDCRKPMVWEDLTYSPERHHPFGGNRPNDENRFDSNLKAWYALLAHYRLAHPSLSTGTIRYLKTDDVQNVLAYHRQTETDDVIVVLNNAAAKQHTVIDLPSDAAGKKWTAGIGTAEFEITGNRLAVTLSGKSGLTVHSM